MKKIHSILYATDFKPASKEALYTAARMAALFKARVHMFHVLDTSETNPIVLPYRRTMADELLRAYGEELKSQGAQIEEMAIVYGSPAARIVQKAEELDCDLVVLGAGERTRGTYAAGPVAVAVMQHARQPVLAVVPGGNRVEFQKILCPVDGSEVSERGLRNAIRLAKAFNGELTVLMVIPELSWLGAVVETGKLMHAQEEHAAAWKSEFETFMRKINLGGVAARQEVRTGKPARVIVDTAQELGTDVIVMGATGRSGLAQMLMGSVTRGVLEHLPCALLTVQDEDVLLRGVTEEDKQASQLLFVEAKALLEAASYEAALAKLDQVLARNPFHVAAVEARAVACEHLGQHARAARCRRHAQALRQEILV